MPGEISAQAQAFAASGPGPFDVLQISTSTDGGVTWGVPKTTPDRTCVIGGQPLVQPNGTVIMPISDCFELTVRVIRSTDGGETWTDRSFIGQQIFGGPASGLRVHGFVSASIDGAGNVYVVWPDYRSENLCRSLVDDVLLSSSSDGMTWSAPRRIPIAPTGTTTEPMLTPLGIDPSTSGDSARIGLVYYFYPNQVIGSEFWTTDTCQLEVGFISSTNGDRTLSKPQVRDLRPVVVRGDLLCPTAAGRGVLLEATSHHLTETGAGPARPPSQRINVVCQCAVFEKGSVGPLVAMGRAMTKNGANVVPEAVNPS